MKIETRRSGLLTQIMGTMKGSSFAADLPRGGVAELLPGRSRGVIRLLIRSGGGAVLAEHALDERKEPRSGPAV